MLEVARFAESSCVQKKYATTTGAGDDVSVSVILEARLVLPHPGAPCSQRMLAAGVAEVQSAYSCVFKIHRQVSGKRDASDLWYSWRVDTEERNLADFFSSTRMNGQPLR